MGNKNGLFVLKQIGDSLGIPRLRHVTPGKVLRNSGKGKENYKELSPLSIFVDN